MIAQSFTAEGIRLAVEREGPLGAPTVVLLHGGGQTRHSWSRTAARLAEAGYRTVRFDARGHGDSGWAPDGDYSVAAQARDLAEVVTDLTPTRTALVGASVGGVAALDLAASGGTPFAAVVLADIVLRSSPAGAEQLLRFMMAGRGGFCNADEAANSVAHAFPGRPRPCPESLTRSLRRRGDGRLHWHWDPRVTGHARAPRLPDFEPVAARIATAGVPGPVLLVRGSESAVVDQAGVDHLRELVPQLKTETVLGAGHMIVGGANDAFASLLLAHLSENLPLAKEATTR